MRIRPFEPHGDRRAVESLWRVTLEPAWPVLPGALDRVGDGLVAVEDGVPVGFVATGVATGNAGVVSGGVALIMVAPHRQRRGIGTALLDAALSDPVLRRFPAGVAVHAGHGGDRRIWPGVPLDLPAGVAFFTARGWHSEHDCADLTQDLRDHPDAPQPSTVDTAVADPVHRKEIVDFEAEHFPQWLRSFQETTADVLTARDGTGRLLGTLLFDGPDAEHPYRPVLGPMAGLIGCVGVAEHAQGRGVGSAMVAHASRVLRDRGTRTCLVDWVVRESFYGRLGYHPWRRYRMFIWGREQKPGP